MSCKAGNMSSQGGNMMSQAAQWVTMGTLGKKKLSKKFPKSKPSVSVWFPLLKSFNKMNKNTIVIEQC